MDRKGKRKERAEDGKLKMEERKGNNGNVKMESTLMQTSQHSLVLCQLKIDQ